MMRFTKLVFVLGLTFAFSHVNAGGLALSKRDCMDILERWAADPSSVSKHLVDSCKELMGAGAAQAAGQPVPDIKPAAGRPAVAAADPCSGPDAANSVHCWGSWASLAPAAGAVAPATVAALKIPEVCPDTVDECDRAIVPVPQPPPLGECRAGAPCGFATVVPGTSEPGDGNPDAVVPYSMATDGGQFVVDPGGSGELVSVDNLTPFTAAQPNRFEGRGDGFEDKSIALTRRDTQGAIDQASGVWKHTDLVSPDGANSQSGNFVWGVASSQATLDALNNSGQGISASFSGRMTGDLATTANMQVNFGASPSWTGNWSNSLKNFRFDAGGNLTGVNLVSDPSQFSANVVQGSGSYVQGVLLGERGDLSVGHAVDVTLSSGENIKGVGVLRQK